MDLPSDVLLDVFKTLNSQDMVKMERVSRKWYDVIEENKSLWRRLILPSGKYGWDLPIFERFDEKSESGLVEISLEVGFEEEEEVIPFVELLEKSKNTLQVISITQVLFYQKIDSILSELSWKLPNLVDFRLLNIKTPLDCVLLTNHPKKVEQSQSDVPSKLEVLWLEKLGTLFESHPQIFSNLTSLKLVSEIESEQLPRKVLEPSSKTLKHLNVVVYVRDRNQQELPRLEFPRLQVLQIRASYLSLLPSWISVPHTLTLECHQFYSSPLISNLSTSERSLIEIMVERCPTLSVLRTLPNAYGYRQEEFFSEKAIPKLRKRKEDAEAVLEMDGIQVVHLKTLIIDFKIVQLEVVNQLKELVETVLDSNRVSKCTIVDLR